ncbi:MAG: GNAT family N-acetyltransferase [Clostridia bacterium]|nr:GNAT family N-acetyltransferase [Clostridia bacterium]
MSGFPVSGSYRWNGTDIDALWADDPYRRQGFGTRLLREFEREAKENGAGVVFI